MKRKLNEHDVPEAVATVEEAKVPETKKSSTFEDLGLDARLLQAIAKEKYATPTPIQAKAIPLALEGRDILGMTALFGLIHVELTPFQHEQRQDQAKQQHISSQSYNPF
jgi:hypothetical protein